MNKIALLFPGQGSQHVGMGKTLWTLYPVVKETFEEANEALGFDLRRLCFEGDMEELTKTENTQPAVLTASIAAFRVYMQEIGLEPECTAGHSLGELSALCCAGAISFCDAVKIVRQRGRLMQEAVAAGEGGMAAVSGISRKVIAEVCSIASKRQNIAVISNYNSPEQIVISGHADAVSNAGERLKAMGGRVVSLKVSAPFHSPLMRPAAEKLKDELMKYTYHDLKWPVISNVTARPYGGKDEILENLVAQIVQPVRWQESMEHLKGQGVTAAVEMGPQRVLKNLMKKNAPGIAAFSFDNEQDIQAVKATSAQPGQAAGKELQCGTSLISKCLTAAVCTKNRNWNNEEYQNGVVEPYRKIQAMKQELEKQGLQPTVEQMRKALGMLQRIFATKGTPACEQAEAFDEILETTGTRHIFTEFTMGNS